MLTCKFYQAWINRALDEDRSLSARVARHLARCPHCRRWHEGQQSVISRLRAIHRYDEVGTGDTAADMAGQVTTSAPPFLRARILNEIKSDPQRGAPRVPSRWAWAGTVVATLAVAWFLTRPGMQPAPEVMVQDARPELAASGSVTDIIEVTTRFTDGGRLLQVATNVDQPLQREMQLVLADARAALRSLQSEFVPGALLAKSN